MKLTKATLKELIKEELLKEVGDLEVGKTTAADVRRDAAAAAKEQSGSGLTDQERNLIKQVVGLLTQSGGKTDLLSGAIAQKLKQLIPVLQKVAGEQTEQEGDMQ